LKPVGDRAPDWLLTVEALLLIKEYVAPVVAAVVRATGAVPLGALTVMLAGSVALTAMPPPATEFAVSLLKVKLPVFVPLEAVLVFPTVVVLGVPCKFALLTLDTLVLLEPKDFVLKSLSERVLVVTFSVLSMFWDGWVELSKLLIPALMFLGAIIEGKRILQE